VAGVSPAFFARKGRSLIELACGSAERRPISAMFACKHLVGRDSVEPLSPSQLKVFLPGYPRLSFSSPYNTYDVAWARARKIERISFAEPALAS
jgi:hypothetical protein